jgi:membrane-bound metal-dependent hydrolase YbcI (DUF457 family)
MSPITHLLLSWAVAEAAPGLGRRDKALVTVAGIAPDLDGVGLVAEVLTRHSGHPLLWWTDYHHLLGHNLAAAIVYFCFAAFLARARLRTASLAFVAFHLHLFCDVVGARGPDGYQWPIPYLYPFTSSVQWTWQGQWALNAWQNLVITAVAMGLTLFLARRRGYSLLGLVLPKADEVLVAALRARWPIGNG